MLIEALGMERSHVISLCGAGGKTTLMLSLAREFAAAGERVLATTTTKIARDEADGWPVVVAGSASEIIEAANGPTAGTKPEGALIAYSRIGGDGYRLIGYAPELVDELARSGRFDRILVEADGSARRPLKAPAAHEPVIPGTSDTLVIVAGISGLGLPLDERNLFRAEIWSRLSGLALGQPISAESLASCVAHPDGLGRGCPAGARKLLFLNQADTPERRALARSVAECLAALAEAALDKTVIGSLLPRPEIVDVISY